MQDIEIQPYNQTVYAQTRICLGECDVQIIWDFEKKKQQKKTQIPKFRPEDQTVLINNEKKKRIYCLVDFEVPTDHRGYMEESEMINKYLETWVKLLSLRL